MIKSLKIKIDGMRCSSCALDIDGTLEEKEGITRSNTSYAKSETTVNFEAEKIDEQEILQAIRNTGYTARVNA